MWYCLLWSEIMTFELSPVIICLFEALFHLCDGYYLFCLLAGLINMERYLDNIKCWRRISYGPIRVFSGPIRPESGPRVDQDRTRRALSDGLLIFFLTPLLRGENPDILPQPEKLRVPQNSDQMASSWVRLPRNSWFSRIFLNFRIFLAFSRFFWYFSNFLDFRDFSELFWIFENLRKSE